MTTFNHSLYIFTLLCFPSLQQKELTHKITNLKKSLELKNQENQSLALKLKNAKAILAHNKKKGKRKVSNHCFISFECVKFHFIHLNGLGTVAKELEASKIDLKL